MSRSYRRPPILPFTNSHSEKIDKQQWHRRWRLHERIRLTARLRGCEAALEGHLPVAVREVGNLWSMDKDERMNAARESTHLTYPEYVQQTFVASTIPTCRRRTARQPP